ncbi:RNA 2',3'-cyclic phosphodiesterase [Terrilactibacillus laevilacticus]|uniref:RNA 2',3'-cyclic phosphodiesterase n=1 Tax=Terrilactibacillus laevilacticus TaxID=1380157 RepID=A0ABW5PTJ1_9BACI|nr:RNA 2',3'-cyclic phosphodiesterase [Terrilactibacillus laevilacticus]
MDSHYFIGIKLPENVNIELSRRAEILKQHVDYKQWTHTDDFHITLAFLGASDEKTIHTLIDTINKEKIDINPFIINLEGIGGFGHPEHPRVVYGDIAKNEPLSALKRKIDNSVRSCGFKVESRPYHPHITITKRWIGPNSGSLNEILQWTEPKPVSWICNEFMLFRIELNKAPKYNPIEIWPFG